MTGQHYRIVCRLSVLALLLLAACGPDAPAEELVLPTRVPTEQSQAVAQAEAVDDMEPTAPAFSGPTLPPSFTPTPSVTPSATVTATPTATPTNTPTVTPTPTNTPTPTPTATPTPDTDAVISGGGGANLRRGPGTQYSPPLALLASDTGIDLSGRTSDSNWFEVVTRDGARGWVSADLITVYREIELPVTWVEPTPVPQVIQNPVAPPPAAGQPPPSGGGTFAISQRTRQIYQTGRQRGNQPTVFSKVGDSITANQPFLVGYDSNQYNLGPYGGLQATINQFRGSFGRTSLSAFEGFNAAAMLDPIWATDPRCTGGESPLACEVRVMRPSVAIIMLGSVDVQLYSAGEFNTYMSQIVNYLISQGVIPVLTTFPNVSGYYPAESEAFNSVIRSIAAQNQTPLIDLRSVAMGMPGSGVEGDGFHLTHRGDSFIDLNGEQNQFSMTMRNFMTLQMLESIWRGVPMG